MIRSNRRPIAGTTATGTLLLYVGSSTTRAQQLSSTCQPARRSAVSIVMRRLKKQRHKQM